MKTLTQPSQTSLEAFHGEQMFPGTKYSTEDSTKTHIERYEFAKQHMSGKTLDASCGSGYGTDIMGLDCIGIDHSDYALSWCREHYNNTFLNVDMDYPLPFESESFDGIVSLETLEHVANQDMMLSEFKRVLKPGGTLVITTPNRDLMTGDNDYHVAEVNKGEFLDRIGKYFTLEDFYGQTPVRKLPLLVRTIKPILRPPYTLIKYLFGTFGEPVARTFRPFTLGGIEKALPGVDYHELIGVYKKMNP